MLYLFTLVGYQTEFIRMLTAPSLLSFQGLGTTDSVLIRIMVARAEIDMLDIKTEFLKAYGKTLHSFIKVRPWSREIKYWFVSVKVRFVPISFCYFDVF